MIGDEAVPRMLNCYFSLTERFMPRHHEQRTQAALRRWRTAEESAARSMSRRSTQGRGEL